MICPKCKKELPKHEFRVHALSKSKTKTPKLVIQEYRVKYCEACDENFYVEDRKIQATKIK